MVSKLSVPKLLCDLLLLSVIAMPLLIFEKFVQPFKRGFYCDDETIRYPFRPSTVPRELLIVVGIIISTFLILITEVFCVVYLEKRITTEFDIYRLRKYNVHRFIVRLYVFFGYFFVGALFNQLMVNIGKYTIGRLRPHFVDVCRPSIGYDQCQLDYKYINETSFTCTGKNTDLIEEARLSFYSGHAAFSFYVAWYMVFYLQARLYRPLMSRLVLPVIQFSLFAAAFYVSYTRVTDFQHHWSDVLMGAIMGSIIGSTHAILIAEVFSRREVPQKYCKTNRLLPRMFVRYNSNKEQCIYSNNLQSVNIERGRASTTSPEFSQSPHHYLPQERQGNI